MQILFIRRDIRHNAEWAERKFGGENECHHQLLSPCQTLAAFRFAIRRILHWASGSADFDRNDFTAVRELWTNRPPNWGRDRDMGGLLYRLAVVDGLVLGLHRAINHENQDQIFSLCMHISATLHPSVHRRISRPQPNSIGNHIPTALLRHVLHVLPYVFCIQEPCDGRDR